MKGRFATLRRITYAALIGLWALLPWIPIGGHPAVFLDVDRRQFFLFGLTFNAQDTWLLFFLVSGFGFGLLYVTALLGRAWCGWACPQTVFIEGIFRPIERLLNGPRNEEMKRAKGPMNFDRAWRLVATHGFYVLAALFVAHVFLAYFVSIPKLFGMVGKGPGQHPEAFAWMLGTTALFYVNFGIFREQFCVVMCPYGRLQSVLLDDDALIVGYDEKRGEPRGKAKKGVKAEGQGDCVDCNRCVVVCPTAIDIRQGLQLDCIACTACIDACDEVMDKLERPRGLIRYDSQRGLRGEKTKILRPRVYGYTVLMIIGAIVAGVSFHGRTSFEANILRLPGPPYTIEGETIRDGYKIHLVNKTSSTATFTFTPKVGDGMKVVLPLDHAEVPALGSQEIPFYVTMTTKDYPGPKPFAMHVEGAGSQRDVTVTFLGARQ